MKKNLNLASIAFIFILSSCVVNNQEKLNLNIAIAQQYSDFGNNKLIEVVIKDERKNPESLGNKRIGEDSVNIKSYENLNLIVKNKVIRDLEQNGFTIAGSNFANENTNQFENEIVTKELNEIDLKQNNLQPKRFYKNKIADKALEVKILTFNYQACREFLIGNSKMEVVIKITAINQNGAGQNNLGQNASYSTTQSFILDKNHFIMPLTSTDEKTINFALQEALDSIFTDHKLLEFLKN